MTAGPIASAAKGTESARFETHKLTEGSTETGV